MKDDPRFQGIKERAVTFDDLEHEDVRQAVRDSDIVYGLDTSRDELILFYGIAALKRIVRRDSAEDLRVMAVKYDQTVDDELEFLCACVKVLKGACCYESGGA